MTFLDSSVIIDVLAGVSDIVEERGRPDLKSAICLFEDVDGTVGSGETGVVALRQQFGGVRARELNESRELGASLLQYALMAEGTRTAPRDLLIMSTARSTEDESLGCTLGTLHTSVDPSGSI